MQRQIQAIEDEKNACAQLLTWHSNFNLNGEIEKLSTSQREFELILKAIDLLKNKRTKEVAIERELLPNAKLGINPSRWFSSERIQYAKLLKESRIRLAEIDAQTAENESKSLTISAVNTKRQQTLNKYRTLDTLEQKAKLNSLELRLEPLRSELTYLLHKRQRIDALIQSPLSEKRSLQQRLEALQEDVKLAETFDQRLTTASNSYEKAMVHNECGNTFGGESKPSRVKHNKQREIESVHRNLEKVDARLQQIVLTATRKISRLVIDGNNLCYEGRNFIGLEALTALTYAIAKDYEVIVVFDASIRKLLGLNDQQIAYGFPREVRVHVVASKQAADQTVLEMASDSNAYVISNDRFRDFTDKPAVNAQRLIRHEILAGKVMVHDLDIAITYDLINRSL
jgi:hypothetical protein